MSWYDDFVPGRNRSFADAGFGVPAPSQKTRRNGGTRFIGDIGEIESLGHPPEWNSCPSRSFVAGLVEGSSKNKTYVVVETPCDISGASGW
jgi:hypothetical protein